MSAPPPVPSIGASTIAVARITALRLWRGRKLRVALIATVVIILFPGVVALFDSDSDSAEVVKAGIDWGIFRLLVYLIPLLFTSGIISEEVEARTLHFLTMRPASRFAIGLGKFVVSTGASIAVIAAGILLLHVIGFISTPSSMVEELPATMRALGSAVYLTLVTSGICLFWGALVPDAGRLLAILHFGLWELGLVILPGIVRMGSITHYARELADLPQAGVVLDVFPTPEVEPAICALVIGSGALLFTGFGLLVVQLSELRPRG